jgi:hypothetical protein
VDPLDELSIATAMRHLLSSSEVRARVGKAGLKRSSAFSSIEMGRRTLEVYEHVMGDE